MLDISVKEGVLRGSGVAVFGAFSVYGLGITWSCLLAITFWALYVTIIRIAHDSTDERQSIENLQTTRDPTSKRKRILAKKKEKYEKKRRQPATDSEDEDELDTGLKRSQELVDENMYGSIDYEAAAAYHGVFAMPSSDSKKLSRRYIPSLKSPQPLLSAFHSRISRREYNAMSPTILSNRNYPLSPRSVFDNIHNRNISSPLNRSRMATETPNIFKEQSFDAQRAFSPPSGKYFSRIRPDFPQDSRIDFEVTNNSVARKGKTVENQLKTGNLDDSCSKEAIIKVLQEKSANKRKRIWHEVVDTPTVFQDKSSKKRRIDDSAVDETVMETERDKLASSKRRDLSEAEALERQTPPACGSRHALESGPKESKEGDIELKNKYGLGDSEMESLGDDENMENEKTQSKRKIEGNSEITKGKKAREDKPNHRKKKDAKQTPALQDETKKKATPVRSIETQTPANFEEKDRATKSPRTPTLLKTPYKKVFVSGFPSNLKPESTEKRRKVPIYSGGFRYNENIEIGLEEYGSLGVTSAAYTADKKAALERVMSLLSRSDNDDNDKEGEKESAPTSLATNKSEVQPVVITQMLHTSSVAASNTVSSLAVSSKTAPSLMPMAAISVASFSTSQITIDTVKSSSQKTDGSLIISSSKPVAAATGFPSDGQLKSSISNPQEKATPFSLGLQAALSTKTTAIVTSSVTSSALFGNPQPSSITLGGFNFGSQPSSSAPPASSSAPSITLVKPLNVSEALQTSQALKVASEAVNLPQPGQPSLPGFGAFNFGTSIASSQSLKSQTHSGAISTSSIKVANPAVGISFGISSSAQKQPATDNRTQISSETPLSSTLGFMPKAGGFSFGTTVSASSQTLSSSTFGGFNFGTNLKAIDSNSAVSSIKATVGDLKVGATTSSTPSFGGFSFGSAFSSQTPKVDSVSANFGVKSQTGITTSNSTTSIFHAPSTNLQSTFGSKSTTTSTVVTNLFGAPTTSVAFGSQPQLGIGQSIASGQLFATPSTTQAAPLFGVSTKNTSGIAPTFGLPPQSSSTIGSLFTAPTLGTNASGSLFNSASQASSSSAPVFGAPTQNTGSVFNASSQNSQQSGLLFGAQQRSTAAPAFEAQAPTNSFSFGSNQAAPLFGGAAKTTSAAIGGFSFASNSQAPSASNKAITQFGQSNSNAFGQFGAQASSGSNPFANASAFGQAPVTTTTQSGFSFGAASAPTFGQTNSSQPSFGAAAQATFQPVVDQPQTGGFNFAAVATQKPASFSFGGASSGGFASRPGTPTPFNNPPAPVADIFASPQPQGVGFAMGSGAPNRPTVRGRRRTRR